MDEVSDNLGAILGRQKFRYTDMNKVFTENGIDKVINSVNEVFFFINLHSLFSKAFTEYGYESIIQASDEYKDSNNLRLASDIVNFAGHYKHFFFSIFNVHSTIIFYYSDCQNQSKIDLFPDYKSKIYARNSINDFDKAAVISNYIKRNIEIAKKVCNYVPNVYIANTGTIDPETWPSLFIYDQLENVNCMAIIYSNIDNEIQNVFNEKCKYTVFLKNTGDTKNVQVVTRENVYNYLYKKSKIKRELEFCSFVNFRIIFALLGNEKMNVPPVKYKDKNVTFLKAMTLVKDLELKNQLSTKEFSMKNMYEVLKTVDGLDLVALSRNYKLLVLDTELQMQFVKASELIQSYESLIDLVSQENLDKLNNSSKFTDYPIIVSRLIEGETIL